MVELQNFTNVGLVRIETPRYQDLVLDYQLILSQNLFESGS
jgi:hypothetical protein